MKEGKAMSMLRACSSIFEVHLRGPLNSPINFSFISYFPNVNAFLKFLYHLSILFFNSVIWTSPLNFRQNSIIDVKSICKESLELLQHSSPILVLLFQTP